MEKTVLLGSMYQSDLSRMNDKWITNQHRGLTSHRPIVKVLRFIFTAQYQHVKTLYMKTIIFYLSWNTVVFTAKYS